MSKYLKLADLRAFDAIGFDLDHTFAKYKNENLFNLAYKTFATHLTSNLKLSTSSKDYITTPITNKNQWDLVNCKGWIYDNQKGCYAWVKINKDETATVQKVLKGFNSVTTDSEEISKIYENCKFTMLKRLLLRSNIESAWHPTNSSTHHVIENNFEFAYFAIHLKLLDLYYEGELESDLKPTEIREKANDAICFAFGTPDSPYFEEFTAGPQNFLEKSLKIAESLKTLEKPLFLITNSAARYSMNIGNEILGPEWHQLFDFIIYKAKKPNFFTGTNGVLPCQSVNKKSGLTMSNVREVHAQNTGQARSGSKTDNTTSINDGFYIGGNHAPINELVKNLTGKDHPNVVYFGDSLVSDVMFNVWQTCYVETDVDYPEWVEKLTPERSSRLCEFLSEKHSGFRVRTLDDLVE